MNFFKISNIFNLYDCIKHSDQIHTRTVIKCDFDFLTEWFYPMFRKTFFTGQYLDRSIPRSRDRDIDR